jgi:hypothetical protein
MTTFPGPTGPWPDDAERCPRVVRPSVGTPRRGAAWQRWSYLISQFHEVAVRLAQTPRQVIAKCALGGIRTQLYRTTWNFGAISCRPLIWSPYGGYPRGVGVSTRWALGSSTSAPDRGEGRRDGRGRPSSPAGSRSALPRPQLSRPREWGPRPPNDRSPPDPA